MSEDGGSVIIHQGASWASSLIAQRVRDGATRTSKEPPAPEPERPARRAAEALVAGQTPELEDGGTVAELAYGPMLIPDDVFESVEDREAAKLLMLRALRSKSAVHVLLVGDPASGKSQLLQCVARLPQTRYAVGGMTTSSGMVDYLLERRSTQVILIDELDKADPADYAALYSLMESGTVPRLQHGKTEVLRWRGRVFAAANQTERIPEALLSRFVRVHCEVYNAEQMREISAAVLVRQEHIGAARAREIAELVTARGSRDPRDAVQVARLAGEDGELGPIVAQVVKTQRTG